MSKSRLTRVLFKYLKISPTWNSRDENEAITGYRFND